VSARPEPGHQFDRASPRSAISNAIVQLHARFYGRGPTKARTHLNEDYALVVLEEVFTPAERTLISAGRFDQVVNMRSAFQEALTSEFREVIEAITGRQVRAFMSQINANPEVAVDLFLFEPREGVSGAAASDGAGPG
jgi:uncharacterized protein YbcI